MRSIVGLLLFSGCMAAIAEPFPLIDACFVRYESLPDGRVLSNSTGPTQSRLGIRRKTERLFEVELSVVGQSGAVCAVSGVARLRDAPEGAVLTLPVRPDGSPAKRLATPCLVYVRAASDAVEIATTEAHCQTQSLCAGQVQLHGQRFELSSRVPSTSWNPCFAQPVP